MNTALKKITLLVFLLFYAVPNVLAQDELTINVTKVSEEKKYGRKPNSAIKVGTVANEYDYLAQLCGPKGEKIKYVRIKSCCSFKCPTCPMGAGLLDEWEIKYSGLKKPITIYINGYLYDENDEPKAPKGLGIKSKN